MPDESQVAATPTGNPYMSLETENIKGAAAMAQHFTYALISEQMTNIRNMNRVQESSLAYWSQRLHTLGPMEARSQVNALTADATAQQGMSIGGGVSMLGQWGQIARAMVPQPVYVVGGFPPPNVAPPVGGVQG